MIESSPALLAMPEYIALKAAQWDPHQEFAAVPRISLSTIFFWSSYILLFSYSSLGPSYSRNIPAEYSY
eukprot:2120085-Prymnesium_polylepis.1